MDLSERIAQSRKAMKLSQEKFGEIVGKSQRTVAAWEAGERSPSFDTLCVLADALGVSTDYLLGRTEIPNIYMDTKKDPSQEELERAKETAAAALSGDPLNQDMPKDVKQLSALIEQIVDQALDKRSTPSGDQSG